jgi:hypothetical protein
MNSIQRIAIGPRLPEFGSWQWLGEGLTDFLTPRYEISHFQDPQHPPAADVVVFLKFLPPDETLAVLSQRSRIIFMPIDIYGSSSDIDERHRAFASLERVFVHCHRLTRYFSGYCPVEYIDHPLKFVTTVPRLTVHEGPLVWVGRRCNLPPVIEWINRTEIDQPIWLLTDLDGLHATPNSFGIRKADVVVEKWSHSKHGDYLLEASAVIDVKGDDFRARHKPPAKVLDFLASGIPAIVNRGSSIDAHVSKLGITPLYIDDWSQRLTSVYRRTVWEFASQLRPQLSPLTVWSSFERALVGWSKTECR